MVEQVDQIVQMVADKLGVVADEVYPILLKQADVTIHMYQIGIWITGFTFVLFIIAVACCIWACNNVCAMYSEEIGMTSVIVACISGLITFIGGLVLLCEGGDYFTALYNPDMYVIKLVTNMLQ